MELRTLKYFVVIVQEENITNAAKKLFVSQPALSRQISELEKELGTPLLNREGRRITLTEDGASLYEHACAILDLVDNTQSHMAKSRQEIEGEVFVGCGESANMRKVFGIAKRLSDQHPLVRFNFTTGASVDLMHQLTNGYFDYVIQYEQLAMGKQEFDSALLNTVNPCVALVRKDHPLSQNKQVCLNDLSVGRFAASRQFMKTELVRGWLGASPAVFNVSATYNLPFNGVLMVEEDLADFMLIYDDLITLPEDSNLQRVELIDAPVSPELIVWKKGRRFSRAAQLFLEMLLDELGR